MYAPDSFREDEPAVLQRWMRTWAFALLTSVGPEGPVASHVPLWLDPDEGPLGTLYGHLARANPQWRGFDGRGQVLAVFAGPHGYVSPRWYASAAQVPTWNYVAVHARGAARLVDDPARVHAVLRKLAGHHEPEAGGWSVDELPLAVLDGLVRGIVSFRLPIERLRGKRKLSQNKAEPDRRCVIDGLRKSGRALDGELAQEMERALDPPGAFAALRPRLP